MVNLPSHRYNRGISCLFPSIALWILLNNYQSTLVHNHSAFIQAEVSNKIQLTYSPKWPSSPMLFLFLKVRLNP